MNFRIYWDGDLQDELLDGATQPTTEHRHPKASKDISTIQHLQPA